jgi:hypothetical protein
VVAIFPETLSSLPEAGRAWADETLEFGSTSFTAYASEENPNTVTAIMPMPVTSF